MSSAETRKKRCADSVRRLQRPAMQVSIMAFWGRSDPGEMQIRHEAGKFLDQRIIYGMSSSGRQMDLFPSLRHQQYRHKIIQPDSLISLPMCSLKSRQ